MNMMDQNMEFGAHERLLEGFNKKIKLWEKGI